jgi:hypothetical protein
MANTALVSTGEYGIRPPLLYKNFWVIVILDFLMASIINHYAHNKGKHYDLEICISKKHKISIIDLEGKMLSEEEP